MNDPTIHLAGMILSTRESPEMRRELLRVGMSQVSAGSRTDVGAYHRWGQARRGAGWGEGGALGAWGG